MQPEPFHSLQGVLQSFQGLEVPEIRCTMSEEFNRRSLPQLLKLDKTFQPY